MNDNKTVLLPSSEAQNTLTGFSSNTQHINEPTKGKQNATQQLYKTFLQNNESDFIDGMNPFISLAKPIFMHINKLLHTYDLGDVGNVHTFLIEEIDFFTQTSTKYDIDNSQIIVARYLLCTFLDELICTTHWGKNNDWARDSLLGHFYRETYGGEKFFQILTKLLASPAVNIHLLEFMYVCISLGFEGKYRIQPRGKMELDTLRENLYKQIKMVQGRQVQTFYTEPKISSQQHHYVYKAPYLTLIIISIIVLTIIYSSLSISLNRQEDNLLQIVENTSIQQKIEFQEQSNGQKDLNVKN
ncbi:MAG: type IVB secretion system protein IcmH/DotU [Sulfuricurvum sp.]|nr:type IVB secretion system protein IcmH/DotU [Sulfuricurvum sp.]